MKIYIKTNKYCQNDDSVEIAEDTESPRLVQKRDPRCVVVALLRLLFHVASFRNATNNLHQTEPPW